MNQKDIEFFAQKFPGTEHIQIGTIVRVGEFSDIFVVDQLKWNHAEGINIAGKNGFVIFLQIDLLLSDLLKQDGTEQEKYKKIRGQKDSGQDSAQCNKNFSAHTDLLSECSS